ncbi:MAG: metal ABC transporter substrate-binding protein [Bacillota bacterium]|nr:metal ABC transporter substrate-binding protein [Bacillota bacterium]
MKRIICLALFLLIFLTGCQGEKTQPQTPIKVQQKIEAETYLRIETTNKLLYYMVRDIVKDHHDVEYMMVDENDQWKFEYTEDSLNNIAGKDLFIYFGGGFEPWVDDFVDKLKKGGLSIVDCSRGIKSLGLEVPRKYGDTEIKDNPYYWMDSNYYEIALSNIKNAIEEKDPKNRSYYEDNFQQVVKKLDDLNKKFSGDTEKYKKYTFITLDDSLDYFFKFRNIQTLNIESMDISEVLSELDKRKSDSGQFVLAYDVEASLTGYESLIGTYNMKTIKIEKYNPNKDYTTLLNDNYISLSLLPSPAT